MERKSHLDSMDTDGNELYLIDILMAVFHSLDAWITDLGLSQSVGEFSRGALADG